MKWPASNRRTAIAAAAACLVLIICIAVLTAKTSTDVLARPSTFFTDSTGARAMYLIAQRTLPVVEQWRLPITELKLPASSGATLIAMAPDTFGQDEARALDQWVAAGGQLILASNTDWHVQRSARDRAVQDFLARHDIRPGLPARNAVNAAVTKPIGKGRIVYVSESYAFSNASLRATDNAVWLIERCTEWGGTTFFDEYHHGFGAQRGLTSLTWTFLLTPWGFVCGQIALAGVVFILGSKRRFGRPLEELPAERTNPIETVEALAGLFETARARALSARAIHRHLNSYLSGLVGYRTDVLSEQSHERLAGPLGIAKTELAAYSSDARAIISGRARTDEDLVRFALRAAAIARSFNHDAV